MRFLRDLHHRLRPTAAATAAALLLFTGTAVPVAGAVDVDELIASMEEISHEASATNEEVKQLEVDIEEGEARLIALREEAEEAKAGAEAARAMQKEFQKEVNDLAGAKYRGLMIDPVTNAIAAASPQNAIDRAAFMGTLTRNTERVAGRLADATAAAGRLHTDASRALAESTFQQSLLEEQRSRLERDQELLQDRIRRIEEQVANLDPASRARWEHKNNPLAPLLSGAASGAVGAALSKLGSPYGWGATGPNQFDCSGLMVWAYQQQGKAIPRTSQAQLAGGTPVSRAELQPGDIVGYYPGVTHVGMYIGNGQLVHASDYGIPVQVVSVDSMPWAGAARY